MKYLSRLLTLVLMVSLGSSLGFSTSALAGGKFAAVTVDARTGAILFDNDSNSLRHPASLTKMMTLYIVFQELKAKRITLSTPLRVSRRAAGMAPSKMGLKAGSTITVEQAIKALIIKSANDVAATVAENLGGSESAFASRMTRTARSIGMKRTVYVNASGLPSSRQITTARDQATLGLRLMRDFPQFYPYFRLTSFNFKGRIIRSHNRLVGRFNGTDGIKTGYVNASGYNLVSSTRRGQKRLVGVVLGGRTAARRDAFMMTMLSKAFPKAKDGQTIAAVAGSGAGAIDPLKTLKGQDNETQATEQVGTDDSQQLALVAAQITGAGSVEPKSDPKVLEATLDDDEDGTAPDADSMSVASIAPAWAVEIGDFKTKKGAEQIVSELMASDAELMADKQSTMVPLKRKGGTVYRLVVTGYSEMSAKRSCARIAKMGKDCAVLAPQS